jgi:hypothetical protein
VVVPCKPGPRHHSKIPQRISDLDAKITLARVQILREDSRTATTLRRCHNHSIVEMHSILIVSLHCPAHRVAVRHDDLEGADVSVPVANIPMLSSSRSPPTSAGNRTRQVLLSLSL